MSTSHFQHRDLNFFCIRRRNHGEVSIPNSRLIHRCHLHLPRTRCRLSLRLRRRSRWCRLIFLFLPLDPGASSRMCCNAEGEPCWSRRLRMVRCRMRLCSASTEHRRGSSLRSRCTPEANPTRVRHLESRRRGLRSGSPSLAGRCSHGAL